jgi:hypothetical protein
MRIKSAIVFSTPVPEKRPEIFPKTQTLLSFFMYIADEINHLTSSGFQRHLMADRATKLELILAGKNSIIQ